MNCPENGQHVIGLLEEKIMISNEELLEWINTMPLWFREATLLYYQNNIITDNDVKKLADDCLKGERYCTAVEM